MAIILDFISMSTYINFIHYLGVFLGINKSRQSDGYFDIIYRICNLMHFGATFI